MSASNRHGGGRRHREAAAFTLVELLVATAILSLLLVVLAQAASMVANVWTSGNGRVERRQSGRAVVDFIARELKGATLPADAGAMASRPNLQFLVNPPSVPTAFCQPHALFWQAPVAFDTSKGNMAELGYFVRWSGGRASLCRLFLEPGSPSYFIYTPGRQDSWVNEQVLNEAAPADNSQASGGVSNGYRGLFAENVIGFWVRCLDAKGAAVSNLPARAFDSRLPYLSTDSAGVPVTVKAPALPSSVEISLVVLDSKTADYLAGSAQAGGTIAKIQELVAQTNREGPSPNDAAAFMELATQEPALSRLLAGMTSHKVRIYLDNAP